MIAHRRRHRIIFCLAGGYNILWGLYAGLYPQGLFRLAKLPLLNHPQIFACLGMVVGLYGILYLEVARVPERGFAIAAGGFVGKLLGPLGWLHLVATGRWPGATLILCLTNDFIWWAPFGL